MATRRDQTERAVGAAGRRARRPGPGLALVLLTALGAALAGRAGAPPPVAAHAACGAVPEGGVLRLAGSLHLFVCGADGLLHWAGDTRALVQYQAAGDPLDWEGLRTATRAELLALPRGEPWLSAGLLAAGDRLGLVKWETGAEPYALALPCRAADALFGLTPDVLARLVHTPEAWATEYGRPEPPPWRDDPDAGAAGCAPAPTPTATPSPTPTAQTSGGSGSSVPTATPGAGPLGAPPESTGTTPAATSIPGPSATVAPGAPASATATSATGTGAAPSPTSDPAATAIPSGSPTEAATPTEMPTPTATSTPIESASPAATATETPAPGPASTPTSTTTPTATATATPTPTPTATGASLSASPTRVVQGGTVTATWRGVAGPSDTLILALYAPGTDDIDPWDYRFISVAAAGSEPFELPAWLPPGTYELRLIALDGAVVTRLATSNSFEVTAAPTPTPTSTPTATATASGTPSTPTPTPTATPTWTPTATPTPAPPTLSNIPDQEMDWIEADRPQRSKVVQFTVGDPDTPLTDLRVTATSSDQEIVPNANLVTGFPGSGSASARSLTITPAQNQFGSVTITVTVTDPGGRSASDTFALRIFRTCSPC